MTATTTQKQELTTELPNKENGSVSVYIINHQKQLRKYVVSVFSTNCPRSDCMYLVLASGIPTGVTDFAVYSLMWWYTFISF